MPKRMISVRSLATLVAAALCSPAAAQVTRTHASPGFGYDWYDPGTWSPAATPLPLDTMVVNVGGSFFTSVNLSTVGATGLGYDLIVATGGNGRVDHSAGGLVLGHRLTLGDSGFFGNGLYNLFGVGVLDVPEIYVGNVGGGTFTAAATSTLTTSHVVVGAGAASAASKSFAVSDAAIVAVSGELEIGRSGPADFKQHGGSVSIWSGRIGGTGHTGTGSYLLEPSGLVPGSGLLKLGGILEVGRGAGASVTGTFTNNGGTIETDLSGAEVIVNGPSGRLIGTGTYNAYVTFKDAATVRFSPKSLLTAATMTVTPHLDPADAGSGPPGNPGGVVTALTSLLLPDSDRRIAWSDGLATAEHIDYQQYIFGIPAPTVEVACHPSDATSVGSIPVANIASRVRLMQFGQDLQFNTSLSAPAGKKTGEIRNITRGQTADKVYGESGNVAGAFSVGVVGHAALPRNQNPDIAALHERTIHPLTGRGVMMGQIENGVPDVEHGCFENWEAVTSQRAELIHAPFPLSPHSTAVASLMVGYDPMGIQVEGQSTLEPAGHRYGAPGTEGFGFAGVAPDAMLRSTGTVTGAIDAFNALVAVPGMKVINMSRSLTTPASADGMHPEELNIDRQVDAHGIIFVKSVGNEGPGAHTIGAPGGAYNSMVVGSVDFEATSTEYPRDFSIGAAHVRDSSSRGPTADGRAKPDLVAQGVSTLMAFSMMSGDTYDPAYPVSGNHGLYSTRKRTSPFTSDPWSGSSFASPLVAGVAALMVQSARDDGHPGGQDPRVIKSILLTSADKPPSGWHRGDGTSATPWEVPLSYTWGAGLMDAPRALNILETDPVSPGTISRRGWSLGEIGDTEPLTPYGFTGKAYLLHDFLGGELAATLAWHRHVDSAGTPALANLNLELYRWDPLTSVATLLHDESSLSPIDNVEHIFVTSLAEGDYILRVYALTLAGLTAETYGLSWNGTFRSVPTPGALVLLAMVGTCAVRRRRAR